MHVPSLLRCFLSVSVSVSCTSPVSAAPPFNITFLFFRVSICDVSGALKKKTPQISTLIGISTIDMCLY